MYCFHVFFGFLLVASSIYCLNDAADIAEDKTHLEKSKRLVASGEISIQSAVGLAITLFVGGLSFQIFMGMNKGVIMVPY